MKGLLSQVLEKEEDSLAALLSVNVEDKIQQFKKTVENKDYTSEDVRRLLDGCPCIIGKRIKHSAP